MRTTATAEDYRRPSAVKRAVSDCLAPRRVDPKARQIRTRNCRDASDTATPPSRAAVPSRVGWASRPSARASCRRGSNVGTAPPRVERGQHTPSRLAFSASLGLILSLLLPVPAARAQQIPQVLGYQGRVSVNKVNFSGMGYFKFALVHGTGNGTSVVNDWTNDGSRNGTPGLEPALAVALTVTNGLYSVPLGDTTIGNMTAFPAGLFSNPDERLRIWFDDGTPNHLSQLLTPDQKFSSVAYAMVGGSATTAASFTGNLNGDLTGTQAATVVSKVGGVSSANVAIGANLALGASGANTSGALVKRDGSGNFAAGTISISGIALPSTSSSNVGVIVQNGSPLLHTFGTDNFFAGLGAGNFTMTGGSNLGLGSLALSANTTGQYNTAGGIDSLAANTGGSFNTSYGWASLYSNIMGLANTAIGFGTLRFGVTGNHNTATGYEALTKVSGDNNTANGCSAMVSNTSGNDNTAVGYFALIANTTASNNTAVGAYALATNTSGANNAALGWSALTANSSGSSNTAFGFQALKFNTADSNTALGAGALLNNLTGANEVAVGVNALMNAKGDGNIAIGSYSGVNLTTGSSNICIGNAGAGGESGTIRIGASGVHFSTFIAGVRGVTVSGTQPVYIDSTGQLGSVQGSSRRYKEDINDMGAVSDRLGGLRPVTFRYKQPAADGEKPIQFGLIAEEVAEVFPELAIYNSEGEPESVKYQDLAPLLLNEMQKMRAAAEQQEMRMKKLADRVEELEALLQKSHSAAVPPAK